MRIWLTPQQKSEMTPDLWQSLEIKSYNIRNCRLDYSTSLNSSPNGSLYEATIGGVSSNAYLCLGLPDPNISLHFVYILWIFPLSEPSTQIQELFMSKRPKPLTALQNNHPVFRRSTRETMESIDMWISTNKYTELTHPTSPFPTLIACHMRGASPPH